jgi:hypothetical protein
LSKDRPAWLDEYTLHNIPASFIPSEEARKRAKELKAKLIEEARSHSKYTKKTSVQSEYSTNKHKSGLSHFRPRGSMLGGIFNSRPRSNHFGDPLGDQEEFRSYTSERSKKKMRERHPSAAFSLGFSNELN